MINIKEDAKLNILNHSCAHLLAQAVSHLYKDAKFWVGPVIDDGFYYDIDLGDVAIKEEEKRIKKRNQFITSIGRTAVNTVTRDVTRNITRNVTKSFTRNIMGIFGK